ncbi:MAG: hypothetical protein A2496_17190 [Burkholderiales bacterium RIFOXYC12_FULL_60_6]|nr:MAG: hypothetical protein A2496_17190 [Burkholderiales bacterium RIFOXYC12_FULL_60_6]
MFTPLRFQSALASGGVALMPFVLMQFTFAHTDKLISINDFANRWDVASLFLVVVMLLSTLMHFFLILKISIEFMHWAHQGDALKVFLSDAAINIGIFSPIVALGMTANVLLGPVAFFWPDFSRAVPTLMGYGIYPYALLFLALGAMSLAVAKTWFFRDGKAVVFTFNWLLDVFAWGMVALAGAGITMAATDLQVAKVASILTLIAISMGLLIYGIKGIYLLVCQLNHGSSMAEPLKPAHFVVVPINCLFAIAIYKIADYTGKSLGVDISSLAFVSVVILFSISIFWILFCAVAFKDWFRYQFIKPDFYPSQWGLVCVLVGLEVLAVYSHSNYYASALLLGFSYLSIVVATAIYTFVYLKFVGVIKARKS